MHSSGEKEFASQNNTYMYINIINIMRMQIFVYIYIYVYIAVLTIDNCIYRHPRKVRCHVKNKHWTEIQPSETSSLPCLR